MEPVGTRPRPSAQRAVIPQPSPNGLGTWAIQTLCGLKGRAQAHGETDRGPIARRRAGTSGTRPEHPEVVGNVGRSAGL